MLEGQIYLDENYGPGSKFTFKVKALYSLAQEISFSNSDDNIPEY